MYFQGQVFERPQAGAVRLDSAGNTHVELYLVVGNQVRSDFNREGVIIGQLRLKCYLVESNNDLSQIEVGCWGDRGGEENFIGWSQASRGMKRARKTRYLEVRGIAFPLGMQANSMHGRGCFLTTDEFDGDSLL